MAKRKRYGARERNRQSYEIDLFTNIQVKVPRTLLPILKAKAFRAGLSLESVCATALYQLHQYDWMPDLSVPIGTGDRQDAATVFSIIASVPKGVPLDRLIMLEAHLKMDRATILLAVSELILTGDVEEFNLTDQAIKGVRISSRHTIKNKAFKRFAGEVQRGE